MLSLTNRHSIVLCMACLATVCCSTRILNADIAPNPLSGGKTIAAKGAAKTNVAMVDEIVRMQVSPECCRVDIVFTMKNVGDKIESMQVGFPHNYKGELKQFVAEVDGKPVDVGEGSENRSLGDFRSLIVYWKLWPMKFHPDKPVKIHVSYQTKLHKQFTWTVGDHHGIRNHLTSILPASEHAALRQKLDSREVAYILKTGGHWSGPIESCRIEVTFDGLTPENVALGCPFEPDKVKFTQDMLSWDLKNFEPKFDLRFRITPNITRAETLDLLAQKHRVRTTDPILTDMLAEYLIAADRPKEADQIFLTMLTHWKVHIQIWGKDKVERSLMRNSSAVNSLIYRWTAAPWGNKFHDPALLAPVVEATVKRIQKQISMAAPEEKDRVTYFSGHIDEIMEWCRRHSDTTDAIE